MSTPDKAVEQFRGWRLVVKLDAAGHALSVEATKPGEKPRAFKGGMGAAKMALREEDESGAQDTESRRTRLHRALDCVLDRKTAKDTVEDVIRFREINHLLAKMGEYSKLPPSRRKEHSDLYTERETLVRKMQKEDPAKDAKSRMTPAQKKALEAYKFAEAQEDRYLGSVFVNSVGQRRVEEKTRAAYEECKRLGMGIEHGLDAVAEAQKVNGGFRV